MINGNEENKSKYIIEFLGEEYSKNIIAYKVVTLGRYGVGKTTIINKLMNKESDKEYAPTLSIDTKNIQIKVNDKIIQINMWDCCGNDDFALNTPNLFKNASIGILVYAINDKKSYNDLEKWNNMLKQHSYESIIFLIGNKSDLEKEREVTKEDVETFKNNKDDIKISFETSALNGSNIDKLLENIAITLYEKDKKFENEVDNALKNRITINKEDLTKKKAKKKKFC